MIQSLLYGNALHRLVAAASERSARSREQDAAERSAVMFSRISVRASAGASAVALKALEDSAVFAVYRQEPYSLLTAEICHQLSACDKSLLVSESYVPAAAYRLICRRKAAYSHERIQDYIAVHRSDLNETFVSIADFDARELSLHSCGVSLIAHTYNFRRKLPHLRDEFIDPASACKAHGPEFVLVIPDYLKSLGPDGARAPHYQYFFHDPICSVFP